MPNYAFQITEEDVDNVCMLNGLIGFEVHAEDVVTRFADRIEKAALYGDDLEEQTKLAYDEIKLILTTEY